MQGIRELTEDDNDVLQVQKCGRTTCYTTGTVMDIDVTVDVGYESEGGEVTYRFVHQIFLTDMSDSGDSGSLILDMDMKPVKDKRGRGRKRKGWKEEARMSRRRRT